MDKHVYESFQCILNENPNDINDEYVFAIITLMKGTEWPLDQVHEIFDTKTTQVILFVIRTRTSGSER